MNFTSEEMYPEIQRRVENKIPSAIIRYGDGEGIILNGFKDMDKLKAVLNRQLGEVPPINEIEQIQQHLIDAYTEADIIGIPEERHIDKKGSWAEAFNILEKNVGADVLKEKHFTSIDFHNHFLSNGYFDKLLTGIDTLGYVSCRNLDKELRDKYDIKNICSKFIAPEVKFTSGYKGRKHYPFQFNKVRRWITKIPIEGKLFLYGAGYVGKIYGVYAKQQGAIAIDIGNVFDAWAGKCTRGEGRGMDVEDLTYKL